MNMSVSPVSGSARWMRVLGTIAWHVTMLIVAAVVLIPIIMVFLGSFKTVPEFFSTPYGLPEAFDPFNYVKAWDEANLQRARAIIDGFPANRSRIQPTARAPE